MTNSVLSIKLQFRSKLVGYETKLIFEGLLFNFLPLSKVVKYYFKVSLHFEAEYYHSFLSLLIQTGIIILNRRSNNLNHVQISQALKNYQKNVLYAITSFWVLSRSKHTPA